MIASAVIFEAPFGDQPSEYSSTAAMILVLQLSHTQALASASLIFLFPSSLRCAARNGLGIAGYEAEGSSQGSAKLPATFLAGPAAERGGRNRNPEGAPLIAGTARSGLPRLRHKNLGL